jgi:hypothetical protein
LLPGKKFASPKSSILGLRFLSKENIARFDVTVDDWWTDFFKVGEPISNTNTDLHPCSPVKSDATAGTTCRKKKDALVEILLWLKLLQYEEHCHVVAIKQWGASLATRVFFSRFSKGRA